MLSAGLIERLRTCWENAGVEAWAMTSDEETRTAYTKLEHEQAAQIASLTAERNAALTAVASLTAEVERLKADNAKLLALDRAIRVMNLNRTEPAALVAEVERLRAGIQAEIHIVREHSEIPTPNVPLQTVWWKQSLGRLTALLQLESNDGK